MGSGLKSNWTLEDAGIPGPNFLHESLTNCTDPLKAIEEFQLKNGILLPSLRPMLPLLDLHGIRRLDFHNSVLENLREKLISHINEIGQKKSGDDKGKDRGNQRDKNEEKKLKELLVKSFPLIRIKSLRPVIMCILKNLPQIDDKYLKFLVRDKELYNDIDTEVKRQIWKDNQSLFGDEVSPLLSKYIWDKENILHDHLNLSNQFFSLSPKIRRQAEVVQKLAHMIGSSVKLYDMVLQFLRTLFLRTRNVHYCTLRSELLMAYHDLEIQEIFSVDPCHKFTWCLDACIREKNVDLKKSKELQGFLDSIHKGHEQIIAEISMTLCDPFAINFLANYIIKILQHMINSDALPRENSTLVLLLRMLSLGLSAWKIIGSRDFREQKLDVHLITKFMPALMSLMVDDQVRQLHAKLPPDERESAITVIEHSGPLPETCEYFVKENPIASLLIMYYTLNVVRQKDRTGILRIVPILSTCTDLHSFEDPYLHSLVIGLIALQDEFTNEEFCTAIFDEFFFVCLSHSNVIKHMLKLLWYVHHKLPGNRLEMLMKTLEPGNQHNEMTHKLYRSLQERISEHTNEPSPNNSLLEDDFDSPLMNVPTPAPLYQ